MATAKKKRAATRKNVGARRYRPRRVGSCAICAGPIYYVDRESRLSEHLPDPLCFGCVDPLERAAFAAFPVHTVTVRNDDGSEGRRIDVRAAIASAVEFVRALRGRS